MSSCCEINNQPNKQNQRNELRSLAKKALAAGSLGITVFILGLLPLSIVNLNYFIGQISWFILGLITLGTMIYSGRSIYVSAWHALLGHEATMDTLVSVGTLAAWVFSMIVVIDPNLVPATSKHVYFEASLIIIALVTLGALLETRAKTHTNQAIENLVNLQAKTASRLNSDGTITQVSLDQLHIGDQIQVKPGAKIPIDGIIISGKSAIDESMITGEPVWVNKQSNDTVIGGTMNQSGSFVFRVTKTSKDTMLAQIIDLVSKAQQSKPPITKLVDTVSHFFSPLVIILSIITAMVWFNLGYDAGFILTASMTVLIIACPCALGLAAPISIVAGTGKAAENGILIRHGKALQQASKITTVMLDKTGTITLGKPSIDQIIVLADQPTLNQTELLRYAASVEFKSEHPIASAITQQAKTQQLDLLAVHEFNNTPGYGITAVINAKPIAVGNDKLMQQIGIDASVLAKAVKQLKQPAQTVIYIALNQQLAGLITLNDQIKPDTQQAIAQLQQLGLHIVMLTGDNIASAKTIAKTVNINDVIANVLPEQKAKHVMARQQQGDIVAMVGDGINDAPALTQADVGFAVANGTDIAIESADITLASNSLMGLVNGIAIAKATMRNIKQNLFLAFIYNILGIPIAAGVLYPLLGVLLSPIIAAAAMSASSLTVVSNANRLRLMRLIYLKQQTSNTGE